MTKITIIGSQQSGKTTLAAKLGKKGNVSDFTMYDFAKGDKIMTIIDPTGYPDSVKPLISALTLSDIAILCVPPTGLDAYAGECIVCLESMGYKHGLILLTKSDTTYPQATDELKAKLQKITKGTVLEHWEYMIASTKSFEGMEELKEKIFSMGEKVDEEDRKKATLPVRVIIDQSFNVTGIGCVVLGVVMQGTINAKDKMVAYPTKKPLEIRSIQMHDVDVKTAPSGARVGLALKGIQSKDIDRGHVISLEEMVSENLKIKCKLSPFSKGFNTGGVLHVFVGLQSSPMRINSIEKQGKVVDKASAGDECILELTGTKEISYSQQDRFILTDLDEKQRFVGYGSL
ncbi:EF-Tu/IF-2/RF-3 family GTPase [Methanomethylovorans sp.]|uniref:EF-Tu/IF-2/RF-3 family GTPase n=1 Tax=Methanomethylovorans sp. TaxID=2758717 RepID=UPI00351C1FC7